MASLTLKRQNHNLADSSHQLEILSDPDLTGVSQFNEILEKNSLQPITATTPEIIQINLGKMCNQTCKHCHVDAGPDRKEIMTRETMEKLLAIIPGSPIHSIDLTGGAPELNPNFKWFVEQLKNFSKHIMVRCNLTIIQSNKEFESLPEFYKQHELEIIASLPYFGRARTDAQRGDGVFHKSIQALQKLNKVGYGIKDNNLLLNLVYNPSGSFLPGDQKGLENEFKKRLYNEHGIVFNNLYTITNLPISRFLEYLYTTGNLKDYMIKLLEAFNPAATENLMCRNTLSIGWDGNYYDCDFNQMLDLHVGHIRDLAWDQLQGRIIQTNRHCFGCTAGAGSSCGGALT